MPGRSTRAPQAMLLTGLALSLGWLLLPAGIPGDLTYLLATALTVGAAAAAVPHVSASYRTPALLVTAGLGVSGLADALWYSLSWSGRDPDASLADVYYLAGYVLIGAALLVLLLPRGGPGRTGLDVDALIDVLTVVAVSVLVMWELVVRDALAGTGDLTAADTELAYPLVDAVLLALVARVVVDRRGRRVVGVVVGTGMALWLVGDLAYLAREGRDLLQDVTTVTFALGGLVIAASLLWMRRTDAATPVRDSGETRTLPRLLLAVAPLGVPPLLVVVETASGRDPESWSLVVGISVLIALAFARTERLLSAERSARRDLAAARDAALEASRTKSLFLAGLSHEIRMPMNGVLGLSALLGTSDLDDEQRHYVGGIERAGGALMRLLDDVVDFAKLEDDAIVVDRVDFDVVTLVEDVAAMVADQAHHHGVELVAHCSPGLAAGLEGDPTKLRQVLLNLAANAVAATRQGEVEISAAPGLRGRVRFEVRDTGTGIAPEDQERLFAAFTRLDDEHAVRRTWGGAGLGLAIARSLVAAMGGEIGVESALGRGSTFWCELPLGPARRHRELDTRPSRARSSTRVLVVDDNVTSRRVLATQLRSWDLQVTVTADAASALVALSRAAADHTPYGAVLVDLDLAGTDGLGLVEQVRASPGVADTPVVTLSSGPVTPDARLRSAGVVVSLSKPVGLASLRSAVQRALGQVEVAPAPGAPDAPAPVGRGVVLVADDSSVGQLVATGTLRQLGYLAEVAGDGREAVEMVTTRSYDAVLMDCRMPVLDGYEAAAAIRRTETGRRLPIIAISAAGIDGGATERDRCLAAGMDDVLLKPLGRQQLADALARWVGSTTAR